MISSDAPLFVCLDRHSSLPKPVAAAVRIGLGALALALASRVQLPFVGTPVPFTLGPQMALLLGAVLGPRQGAGAVATWLTLGLGGAPVFASGLVGLPALLAPSGGYALGYLPAAYVVGHLHRPGPLLRAVAAWLLASASILFVGACALSLSVGPKAAFALGVVPFAVTDACKAALLSCACHFGFGRRSLT